MMTTLLVSQQVAAKIILTIKEYTKYVQMIGFHLFKLIQIADVLAFWIR